MSTRQYVGARYVPKFSSPIEWDKNRGYEALEIVTYLGTSYTSKKPVPVGTEIDNVEYWVVTGNYNAQVEQYRQDVENVKTSVNELSSETDKLKETVRYLNNYVTPEMYGAKGDGTTDDADAFQSMFDSIDDGTQVVLVSKNYLIGKPLIINKNEIRISGLFVRSEYLPALITSITDGVLITVNGYGFSASNIVVRSNLSATPTTETTTGIVFNRDLVSADGNIDATLINLTFMRFSTSVDIHGRNVNIKDCVFTENRTGVKISPLDITSEQRGIIIDGCRFHYGIICVQNNMKLSTENSVFISSCFTDGMQVLFTGYGNGVVITGNYCTRMLIETGTFISVTGDENTQFPVVVSNNVFHAMNVKGTIIFLNNQVNVAIIKDNVFTYSKNECINIAGLASGFLTEITGNSFYYCAESGDNAIIKTSRANKGYVINNYYTTSQSNKELIDYGGTPNSKLIYQPNYHISDN